MRIVVIGATGHIGTWLVPRLVAGGHDVVAVSRGQRRPYRELPGWDAAQRVTLDRTALEAEGAFGSAINALAPDVVVDLLCFDTDQAKQLTDSLRGKIEQLVHCGTLWVHGATGSLPYDEAAPRKPFGDYGIRKAEIERYLLDEAERGFPATILHPGHITGPGWNPINPAGNLDVTVFARLQRGESVALPDDGSATLQHVHADDVAQAFALAIANRDCAIGEAFHVAARLPVTMRDYAEAAAAWFDREANLDFVPWDDWKLTVSERDAEITRDHMLHSPAASIAKAESVLGFDPRYTAVDAARDAVSAQNAGIVAN